MRALAMCILALGLVVSPALAAKGGGTGNEPATGIAATSPASSATPAADPKAAAAQPSPSSMEVAAELQQLRDLLEAQAKQLQAQQARMELLEEQLKASAVAKDALTPDPAAGTSPSLAVASGAPTGSASGDDKPGPPTSIQFKGITLTPGGFMAAETVWRSK